MTRLRASTLLTCSILMLTANTSTATNLTSLADRQWVNRLIIVFAQEGTTLLEHAQQWVTENACKLKVRDVQVYQVVKDRALSLDGSNFSLDAHSIDALNQQRRHPDSAMELMLIGKDGSIKATAVDSGSLDDFMVQIDGMPMRRAEASKQQDMC